MTVVDKIKATEEIGDEYGHKIIKDQIYPKVHYLERTSNTILRKILCTNL